MAKDKDVEKKKDTAKTDSGQNVHSEPESEDSKELLKELMASVPDGTPMIFPAMVAILTEMDVIIKKKQGTGINYAFRSIDDVMNALHPLLAKHKVFIVPSVESFESRVFEQDKTDKDGVVTGKRNMFQSLVRCRFTCYTIDGSSVEGIVASESSDFSDKATQQALSYCFKIFVIQSFCIPTKDVTDGDERSPDTSGKQVNAKDTKKADAKAPPPAQKPPDDPNVPMPKEAWDTLKKLLEPFKLDEQGFANWCAGNLRALSIEVPDNIGKLLKKDGRLLYPIAFESKEQNKCLLACYRCKTTGVFPPDSDTVCDKCGGAKYEDFSLGLKVVSEIGQQPAAETQTES